MDDRKHADSHFHLDRSLTCLDYARLSPRDSKRSGSGEFAAYCIPVETSACKPHRLKTEFNMLASTKQVSIAIAVTLGVALSMPLSTPAFSAFAPWNTAMQKQAAPPLRSGALVGLLVKRKYISDDDIDLQWRGPVVDFGLYYGAPIRFTAPIPARVQMLSGSNNMRSAILMQGIQTQVHGVTAFGITF
jgi:hypothetical protein